MAAEPAATVTIAEIEDAIVEKLTSKLRDAYRIEVQRGIEGIAKPAVYVSTEEGSFRKITMNSWRQDITLFVDIVFEDLASEERRRRGIYPILAACVQFLFLKNLGLKINPIEPQSWNNTTNEEQKMAGLIVFTLRLTTAFYLDILDEEKAVDLLRIGLNYYLKPGDDVADASDLVTLQDA